jgi:hypothetical protein
MTLMSATDGEAVNDRLVLKGQIDDIVFMGTQLHYSVAVNGELVTVYSTDLSLRDRLTIDHEVCVAWASDNQRVLADN